MKPIKDPTIEQKDPTIDLCARANAKARAQLVQRDLKAKTPQTNSPAGSIKSKRSPIPEHSVMHPGMML